MKVDTGSKETSRLTLPTNMLFSVQSFIQILRDGIPRNPAEGLLIALRIMSTFEELMKEMYELPDGEGFSPFLSFVLSCLPSFLAEKSPLHSPADGFQVRALGRS